MAQKLEPAFPDLDLYRAGLYIDLQEPFSKKDGIANGHQEAGDEIPMLSISSIVKGEDMPCLT